MCTHVTELIKQDTQQEQKHREEEKKKKEEIISIDEYNYTNLQQKLP